MALTQIQAYEVMYSDNAYAPRIWLKSGNRYIGQLVFHPNGASLPADGGDPSNPSLHYHLDEFAPALDILRNESPVNLLYNGAGAENGLLTGTEAVGEGERALRAYRR